MSLHFFLPSFPPSPCHSGFLPMPISPTLSILLQIAELSLRLVTTNHHSSKLATTTILHGLIQHSRPPGMYLKPPVSLEVTNASLFTWLAPRANGRAIFHLDVSFDSRVNGSNTASGCHFVSGYSSHYPSIQQRQSTQPSADSKTTRTVVQAPSPETQSHGAESRS